MLNVFEFDPALYLNDAQAIDAYLRSALERGTPEEIEEAKRVAARAHERLVSDGPDEGV
jgi:DNA-binding phage protein